MDEIVAGKVPADKKNRTKRNNELKRLFRLYPQVQLATLVDQPPEGEQWLHEIKFDGYRLLGLVSGGVALLYTRNGKDWTERFPSIRMALEELQVKDAVLDMEAIVLNAKGKSSFQALQDALGEGGNPETIIGYAFDLLYLNGVGLTRLPLSERKEKLWKLLNNSRPQTFLYYSEHLAGNGGKMLAKACRMGLEGIVSKKVEAPYLVGREKSWLKSKCVQRQEFIILGYSNARKGERALGALHLGSRKGHKLHYVGKVGTGFSMKGARDLVKRFAKIAVKQPALGRDETGDIPGREWDTIHWLRPVMLCEVAFTEWTDNGRIRHPSFQGLREDKDAGDVEEERPMATTNRLAKAATKKSGKLIVDGIAITHPDRVISRTGQITKGQVAEYYSAVAPFLLPKIARRPLSLLRCPVGIEKPCFYQRNPNKGLGLHVHTFEFKHKGEVYEYLYIQDEKGLLELTQMGAIELHPWGALIDSIDYPDRLIFDLDPGRNVPFAAVKLAAEELRTRLKRRGLESIPKCTGGMGLHVTVPLAGEDRWHVVKSFAASVAQEMVAASPEVYTATMSKAKRTGKIFIDYFRNDYTATAICDYSVRAQPGVPVAVPLEWKELKDLDSASHFTMQQVLKRLKTKKAQSPEDKKQTIPSQ